jgi:hypothetical protein
MRKEDGMRHISRKAALIGALFVAAAAVSAGFGIAAARDDDKPLTGDTRERATAAALQHTGGGRVIETEAGDDGAAYSVEVRRPDGSVVEVNLDESFRVTGQEVDDDRSGESED